MKPFFWRDTKNFGDYTNHWIWPRLIGDLLNEDDKIRLVGIGSLLKSDLNYVIGKKIIFGSGSGYGSFPPLSSVKNWIFYFVRGPLTAERFGLPPEKSIVDGAWLISLLPGFSNIPSKQGTCFIPHWKTAERGNWENVCAFAGIRYVNPVGDFEEILKVIANSSLVITESLHGAIFADLFRTPWIPVKISSNFLNFKWIDWCRSIDVPFNFIEVPPSNFVDCIANKRNPFSINFELILQEAAGIEKIRTNDLKINPPFYYSYIMSMKGRLRKYREKIFNDIKFKKSNFLIKSWDDRHVNNLSVLLKKIALERPFLSKETIKNEKVEKLHIVLQSLRNDYAQGKLFIADK